MNDSKRLAVFAATSGHSGVDRVLSNLLPALAARGIPVDLLHVQGHGPHLPPSSPVRVVELGSRHVNTSLVALVRYLRRDRPHALLSDKDKVNRLALIARALARVPVRTVVRMGTTVSKNLERRGAAQRWLQFASIRTLYRYADAIIVPSQGAAEDLARIAGLAPSRISVLPSPVLDASLQQQAAAPPRHPWLRNKDRPVVLSVGELSARKDFATLVHAFARLRARRPARLIIYGEGRKRDSLLALAAELGVADDVALPGFIDNPYAEMSCADVFALTSNCEGAPVALMEALAVGVASTATDCPSGPREILHHGDTGPLCAVGDSEALARNLEALLDDPPARARLQAAAAPFQVERAAEAYARVLDLL